MYASPNHYPVQHNLDNDTIFSMTHVSPDHSRTTSSGSGSGTTGPPRMPRPSGLTGDHSGTYVAMDGHPDTYLCYNNEQAMKREMHLLSLFKKFVEIQNAAGPVGGQGMAAGVAGTAGIRTQPPHHTPQFSHDSTDMTIASVAARNVPLSTASTTASTTASATASTSASPESVLLYLALGAIVILSIVMIVLLMNLVRVKKMLRQVTIQRRKASPMPKPRSAYVRRSAGTRKPPPKEEKWLEIMTRSVRPQERSLRKEERSLRKEE